MLRHLYDTRRHINHRKLPFLLASVILLLLLSACGQRGDLTLPQEKPKPADPEQEAATP